MPLECSAAPPSAWQHCHMQHACVCLGLTRLAGFPGMPAISSLGTRGLHHHPSLHSACQCGPYGASPAVTAWDRERHILKRELKQGQYNVFAYYLARNAVLIPFEAVQCLLFTAIMYFMAGFQADAEKFFIFFIVLAMFQASYCIACWLQHACYQNPP